MLPDVAGQPEKMEARMMFADAAELFFTSAARSRWFGVM